jgi:ribulose-5-phosphate 4-epimerase/fuculose-1-phosphate aldolase
MVNAISLRDEPPSFADSGEERAERRRQLVLGYRLFAALRWGDLGDGHISARDPELTDHFWLLRYGVAFGEATDDDLVLVAPDGSTADGRPIGPAAHHIHQPIHEARPDVIGAAHTHTQWGTPWSANARLFAPITQEACAFFDDHALFDDEEVDVLSTDGGKRIATALGEMKGIILRNHGLLTVGASVGEAVGWYVMMERVAEAHCKAPDARPISPDGAAIAYRVLNTPHAGWRHFRWLVASHLG